MEVSTCDIPRSRFSIGDVLNGNHNFMSVLYDMILPLEPVIKRCSGDEEHS